SLLKQLMMQRDAVASERGASGTNVKRRDIEGERLGRRMYRRSRENRTHEELGQRVMSFDATEDEAALPEPKIHIPEETDTEDEEEETKDDPKKKKKKTRPNHQGRGTVSAAIERVVKDVAVPAGERSCVQCGTEMTAFGYVEHELVEYIPAKLVV